MAEALSTTECRQRTAGVTRRVRHVEQTLARAVQQKRTRLMIERRPPVGLLVRRIAASAATALLLAGVALVVVPAPAPAANPCAPLINPVACENSKPGRRSRCGTRERATPRSRASPPHISVNLGRQTVQFKINTPATKYHVDIYRHRLLPGQRRPPHRHRPTVGHAPADPAGLPDRPHHRADRLRQLGGVGVVGRPVHRVSGVYIAHLVRDDDSATTTRSRSSCATTPAIRR